ncbi:MAG: hypothetical protein H6865_05390 [Rhodospirillales bacterium]|nr:hypothetical protein [Alphaproteobacteria bacterium]MCB9987053.1 hypothetical protein [Rhodospirillales bacterium]USO08179.1 MAG: hypothetical protein H6866_02900 [Rhodospirillales bacterium]
MPVLTKPAEVPVFLCHDPHWEEQYDQLHSKLRAQWCAARREKDVERRGAIKDECRDTLGKMRQVRLRRFRSVAEVAVKPLNAVRYYALRRGIRDILLPGPEDFKTLAEINRFIRDRDTYLAAHWRRAAVIAKIRDDAGAIDRLYQGGTVMTINPSGLLGPSGL